jgi:formylglycine-generating enzyme required for sulfatase activity
MYFEAAIAVEGNLTLYVDRFPVTNRAYQHFLSDRSDHPAPSTWHSRYAPPGMEEHPVTGVSWHDTQAYAAWASKRLPTAAEWRQAAGQERHYPWGDTFDAQCCNTREACLGATTPVGQYSPAGDSPFGIADMAGNVWEWLADCAGPQGSYRQLRGGAWMYSADFARNDFDRFWCKPEERHTTIGFRLCIAITHEEMQI